MQTFIIVMVIVGAIPLCIACYIHYKDSDEFF